MEDVSYVIKETVSCREEPPDGAVLYYAEKDLVQVINAVGLIIWQSLKTARNIPSIIGYLSERCDGIPDDEIRDHVETFIESLLKRELILKISENSALDR